ncbi:hypothetical protein KB553_12125 [Chryseobacterium rhizoplanae]|uniref:hypothetical protein n=1 Tax=Chryseobacterium rhizoplanae TaxID=1609531 RepID=UPI001CE3156C|nr:hypothetical protein [Chryseobacterium rhizoplanae]UCA57809.1 hypothetical protein KB553_12125 [Chryseobacterium rhizoplanae]
MTKTKADIQPQPGKSKKKRNGLQRMETFFQFNDLETSKKKLNNIMNHAIKRNSRINEDPSVIYHFHQCMQAFVQAGYLMALEEKKQDFNTKVQEVSPPIFGLLSEKEYQNPLLVFKKAFREYSVQEFNYFLSGMVYFSMGIYDKLPERNIINPYIHLLKMLDAAYLIIERKGKI